MPKSVFTDAYKILLQTLVDARHEAGLTQEELGERLGRRQTFISVYERGDRRLDVIEFCAIARAMGYAPESLFKRLAKKLPSDIEI